MAVAQSIKDLPNLPNENTDDGIIINVESQNRDYYKNAVNNIKNSAFPDKDNNDTTSDILYSLGYIAVFKDTNISENRSSGMNGPVYFRIPFQANAELVSESKRANWVSHSGIGATTDFYLWGNNTSREVSLNTSYVITAPDNFNGQATIGDKSGISEAEYFNNKLPKINKPYYFQQESWLQFWTPLRLVSILNSYRSLIEPVNLKGETNGPISPPIIGVFYSGAPIMTLRYTTDRTKEGKGPEYRVMRWIVNSVDISPIPELGYYQRWVDPKTTDKLQKTYFDRMPMGFNISLSLTEVFSSYYDYTTMWQLYNNFPVYKNGVSSVKTINQLNNSNNIKLNFQNIK